MGLKFLATSTIGKAPTTTEIGLREIAFNLADGKIYTNNGTTIVELGADAAGVSYNASLTYPQGSIVSDGGVAYVNMTAVLTPEAFDANKWSAIGTKEVGGLLYDPLVTYGIGAVVADGGKIYISKVVANTNNTPSSSVAEWADPSSSLTYISTFGPNAGLEYPTTPAANTYYRISGLGSIPYIFAGGDLSGDSINDGDEIIFDGVSWTQRPGPTIPAEHGGIAWKSGNPYKSGDLISYNHDVYIALKDSVGSQPDVSPLDWENFANTERAGVAWVKGMKYFVGDAITDNGVMYTALTDHTAGATFAADNAKWNEAFIIGNVDPGVY